MCRSAGGRLRLGRAPPLLHPTFGGQDLFDNLLGPQVAFPAMETAGAELAAIGASHLGRDAQGMAIALIAVEGRIGGQQHALDQVPVRQPPEELLRAAKFALQGRQSRNPQGIVGGQGFPQRFG